MRSAGEVSAHVPRRLRFPAGDASTWRCSRGAWCRKRTDFVGPGRLEAAQCQACGLNLYLPLHATISWDMDAYACRSTATAGFCGEWDILDRLFPFDRGRAAIAEINANRKYWYGDFYPLTPCATTGDAWIAWQLHRPDLDEGLVLAFRRKDSRQPSLEVKLRGLSPDKVYTVSFIDEQRGTTVVSKTGRDLASLVIELPVPRSSVAIRYALKPGQAVHPFPARSSSRRRRRAEDVVARPVALENGKRLPCRGDPTPISRRSGCHTAHCGHFARVFLPYPQILCLFGRLNYREIRKNRNLRPLPTPETRPQDT